MKKQTIIILSAIASVIFLALFALLSSATEVTTSTTATLDDVAALRSVSVSVNDGEETTISLPYTYDDLEPNSTIEISSYFTAPEGNYLYIENDATSYAIYIDEELIYEYGYDESYPDFLEDTISTGQLVYIPYVEDAIHFTVVYTSPNLQESFTISPIYFGSYSGILTTLFASIGFTFVLSAFLVYAGIALMFVTLFILIFERQGVSLFWLGLSTFAIGVWLLAGCNLTGFFLDYPISFYLRSVCGMITFPVALIYFALSTVKFHNEKPLLLTALIQTILAVVGLLLCYLEVIPLTATDSLFDITVPACVCIFAGATMWEYIVYHNKAAQRYSLPAIALALFTLLEFLNRKLAFANLSISFFQIGIIVFLLAMGILAGLFMRDSYILNTEQTKLTYKMNLLEHQINGQKQRHELLMTNEAELKKQRHDLRHQLAVIRELAESNENDQLLTYIDTLIGNIPSRSISYCNNISINAILSHYITIGQHEGITFDINIVDPPSNSAPSDTDYCVIFGNLIENAIEACRHVTDGERFIKLNSRLQYNTLIITMSNSFDGQYKSHRGAYYSRKRNDYGIGLSSIKTIAEKHGGDAQFKADENVFISSVYLMF